MYKRAMPSVSNSDRGASMVDYALLLLLLSAVVFGTVHYMSTNMSRQFRYVGGVVAGGT